MKLQQKKSKTFSNYTGSLTPFYINQSFNDFKIKRFFFVYGNKKLQVYVTVSSTYRVAIKQIQNQTRPTGSNSDLIPPIPPEGFYTPSNPCETEEVIADVFSQ